MKKFITTNYEIRSEKIKDCVRFALLTDLHGMTFGKDNEILLKAIEKIHPDVVLTAGDMIVRNDVKSFDSAEKLLKRIVNQYKVYYSLGNHEYKICPGEGCQEAYLRYEENLKKAGVCFLHNEKAELTIKRNKFTIVGLEIPMIYYRKPRSPWFPYGEMEELIGRPKPESMNILLAHNPKYGKTYFRWGADLILSGHYHGGVLRLNQNRGVISPQFRLFPPFCCGDFHKENRHMLVSAGLGEHTIPIRIHNPRELLVIDVKPPKK